MTLSVHPSVILWLSILFYLKARLLLPFFLAAALHELGHIWMLQILGRPAQDLRLSFSGAVMTTEVLSYREEFLAAAAGPAFSFLGGLLLPLWPAFGFYSLILGLFNALPLSGLDGGRMLRSVLMARLPHASALRISRSVEITVALALWGGAIYLSLALHFGLWPLILGAVLLYKALRAAD